MKLSPALLAAALTLSPALAAAQAKDGKESAKVTITPYGYVLVQGFWNDGPFAARDYPGQVLTNNDGGSFLLSARGTRFGFKVGLPDDPFTGAKLAAVIEADFKGGHIPGTPASTTTCTAGNAGAAPTCTTTTTSTTSSSAWYNSILRLRLAHATASWSGGIGKFSLVAGQDIRVIAPLAPTSLAFGYDQLFTAAGNLNNRDIQLKAVLDGGADLGYTLQVAMLSPQDSFTGAPNGGVDYGAGNRSRMPNLEARLALSYKSEGKKVAEVGVAGAAGWRRYNLTATGANRNDTADTTTKLVVADAVVNLPYVTVQGEAYASDGMEDSQGGFVGNAVYVATVGGRPSLTNLQSRGLWAQAVLKPHKLVSIPVGYGVAELRYKGLPAAAVSATTRTRNSQFAAGLLLNMSNPWKMGFEVVHTLSGYATAATPAAQSRSANSYVLSSRLDF